MADDEQRTVDQQLQQTIALVAQGLEERGMLRAAARELAERHQERIFVSSTGTVRVAMRYGGFYPTEQDNPLRMFVDELYIKAPAEVKTGGFDLEAAKSSLRRTGLY
jgi:hypothetical protein